MIITKLQKIFTIHLSRTFFSESISQGQFGFLDEKQIHDVVGVAEEEFRTIKIKKMPAMVINWIYTRHMTRVSWLYLRLMLIHVGMSLQMVNWTMGCFSSVLFAVLIDGSASNVSTPSRGLRQGCPMSPFIFLLVVEGLSRVVNEYKRDGVAKGIKVIITLALSHLLFVDDVILIGTSSVREAEKYKEILDLSCISTRMEEDP